MGWRPGLGPRGKWVHLHPEGTLGLPATPGAALVGPSPRCPGPRLPPSWTLPGQEGLEGHTHREVGTAGTHCLQDACLVQLLCHVSHIKEAWKLWPWNRAHESWSGGGLKLWGVRGLLSRAEQVDRKAPGPGGGGGELTFPELGLRH